MAGTYGLASAAGGSGSSEPSTSSGAHSSTPACR